MAQRKTKPKNIIVCADGTGNEGGSTPDSNVYKIYKSINRHFRGKAQDGFEVAEQIIFYDNGVGTEKNKYLKALGGAFGFGFEKNVCDLYKFLAQNYLPGDRIYFFGFSRGASTVRACNGFIHTCGLAKGNGLHNRDLDALVEEAFAAYKVHRESPGVADAIKQSDRSHGAIDVHFIGVWDTVVALGFPKQTDDTGFVSKILNRVFAWAEELLDKQWPHNFYHYRLTERVKYAYQALAIDDERTSFWPHVWREKERDKNSVEQVWFAGMHSNVGGGYERSGMASVALHWMMLRAEAQGVIFDDGVVQQVYADSHAHGRMYNSRDGFGFFYRYHPREIEGLCAGRIEGEIKLHRSVIERIEHRTVNYAPGQIPAKFEVVESDLGTPSELMNPGRDSQWAEIRAEIDDSVLKRKKHYLTMLMFSLFIVVAAGWLWVTAAPLAGPRPGLTGHLAEILDYILPDYFAAFIDLTVVQLPYLFLVIAAVFAYYLLKVRPDARKKTVEACERLRRLIIGE